MERLATLNDRGRITAYVYTADDQQQAVIRSLLRPEPQWIGSSTKVAIRDDSEMPAVVYTSATVRADWVEKMLRRRYL